MDRTVLIADDSSTIRKLVTFALKAMGLKVVAVEDGMAALETLPNLSIDLIITDLNMPNVDGYQFISTVRENEEYESIPIIILSSEGQDADIERGIQVGANSYLVKPFVAKRIQYEVAKYLS